MSFNKVVFLFIYFVLQPLLGQNVAIFQYKKTDSLYPKINLDFEKNSIINENHLKPLFFKLLRLKENDGKRVSFVHIGDSHIQADMSTKIVRTELQRYFGNAGRGLIFPYQLAKSNAPSDIIFSSNSDWKGSRLIKKNPDIPCGLSGFAIESTEPNSFVSFKFRALETIHKFDKLTLFTNDEIKNINLVADTIKCNIKTKGVLDFKFSSLRSDFNIVCNDSICTKLYGVFLENSIDRGIIYSAIGVNGAKFSDYNSENLFWNQIKNIKSDCYILSMGTNEAQNIALTPENFIESIKETIEKIRIFNPEAVFILSTPPVSFYKKVVPNKKLKDFSEAIREYCLENQIALWDLFEISKGLEGGCELARNQFLTNDLVHYSKKGYELQGYLFTEAFAKSWNNFLNSLSSTVTKTNSEVRN
ncbi:GDSL-type esterase/lipase family protein [Flavobacterium davisii]|uniref:GDSL-type esterase/lipase family protein n=1 Tax=Flavobacterium davisii TaxID=2906077 RepID=UPI0035CE9334